jgi:hypothetical protein
MTWLNGLDEITPIVMDITKSVDIERTVQTVRKATDGNSTVSSIMLKKLVHAAFRRERR